MYFMHSLLLMKDFIGFKDNTFGHTHCNFICTTRRMSFPEVPLVFKNRSLYSKLCDVAQLEYLSIIFAGFILKSVICQAFWFAVMLHSIKYIQIILNFSEISIFLPTDHV